MSEKEEQIFSTIIDYYKYNKSMPSIRYLQKKYSYKSTNSIYRYLNSLEKQNYLTRNANNKRIINQNIKENYENGLKIINIINDKRKAYLFLKKKKKYLGFIIKNNNFINDSIKENDLLIIEINSKIENSELGLFIINGKYRIMRYFYKSGFYILRDKEEIILNKIKLIGKVILIERTIKKKS